MSESTVARSNDGAPAADAVIRRPLKAVRIDLAGATSVAESFTLLVGACLAQMQANEAGLLGGHNAEYLHQFRVGLRRLRSALRLYRPVVDAEHDAALKGELKWVGEALNGARDWDVFLLECVAPLLRANPAVPGLAAFRRRCAEQRSVHAGVAREAVESPRYAGLKLQIEQLVTNPPWSAADPAPRLLALPPREYAALCLAQRQKSARRLAKDLATADAARRHELRIAAKKLRYAVEFFQTLFDRGDARAYAGSLEKMQDALGLLNDCAVARRLLASVAGGRDAVADAGARGMTAGWLAAREQQGLLALAAARKDWRAQKRFWESALPRADAE